MEFVSVKLQAYSVQIAHYFRKMFQKLVFLKERFMVQYRLNRVQPCSARPALLPKRELTLELTEQALKIHPW